MGLAALWTTHVKPGTRLGLAPLVSLRPSRSYLGTSLKKSNQVDASQWLPFGKLDAVDKGVERPEAEEKRVG